MNSDRVVKGGAAEGKRDGSNGEQRKRSTNAKDEKGKETKEQKGEEEMTGAGRGWR